MTTLLNIFEVTRNGRYIAICAFFMFCALC